MDKKNKEQKIKWTFKARTNTWEGRVNGVEMFNINGLHSLTKLPIHYSYPVDTDECKFSYPDHYLILSIQHAKEMAADLLNGRNLDLHENNRKEYEDKVNSTVNLIQSTEKLLKDLENHNSGKIVDWTLKNVPNYGIAPKLSDDEILKQEAAHYIGVNYPAYMAPSTLEDIYYEGAKSIAAKNYWFKQFNIK